MYVSVCQRGECENRRVLVCVFELCCPSRPEEGTWCTIAALSLKYATLENILLRCYALNNFFSLRKKRMKLFYVCVWRMGMANRKTNFFHEFAKKKY